jgi:hypothetical protein
VPSQSGESVPPSGLPLTSAKRGTPPRRKRPLAVTLVALYQILRTVPLWMVVASLWGEATVDLASRADLRMLIYLVTRRDIAAQEIYAAPIEGIFLVLALYYVATGLGLLLLMSWARRAAMVGSGMAMLKMAWFFVSAQAQGETVPMTSQQQVFLAVFILMDALVLGALLHEARTFEKLG